MKDLAVGEEAKYYGYPIFREEESEYCVRIYADDLAGAQSIIKRCLQEGIIEWPAQAAGRAKSERSEGER